MCVMGFDHASDQATTQRYFGRRSVAPDRGAGRDRAGRQRFWRQVGRPKAQIHMAKPQFLMDVKLRFVSTTHPTEFGFAEAYSLAWTSDPAALLEFFAPDGSYTDVAMGTP